MTDTTDAGTATFEVSRAAARLWLAASMLAWAGGVGGRVLLSTSRDDWVSFAALLAAPAIIVRTAMLPMWFDIIAAYRLCVAVEVLGAIGWALSLWMFGSVRTKSTDRDKLAPLVRYGGAALLLVSIVLHSVPSFASIDLFLSIARLIYPLDAALAIVLALHMRKNLPAGASLRSLMDVAVWTGGIWLAMHVLSLLAEDGEARWRIFVGEQLAGGACGIVWTIIMTQIWLAPRVNPPAD